MKTYKFGLPNSERVIEIVASSFREARTLFKAQLQAEGLA
jgi:hypothetical protein